MTQKPLIGITLDSEDADPPGGPSRYSKFDWYALRQNYASHIAQAGGVPIALPHEPELAEEYLSRIDGLLVTGGAFDVDPALFGAATRHATVKLKSRRTAFELAMVKGALARDMPIYGICGGQQLLAVVLGCPLIQHIPDAVPNALAHEQPNPRNEPGHEVALIKGTVLHRLAGVDVLPVNSAHHQAVASVTGGVVVNARSRDGVIEGIEAPAYRFCLGVQWHPEFHISPADAKLAQAFVKACADD
ncbi:MAG: gamma-glutamyl-gamma-aminobutyrate hydrolase [Alphaproteobacteria bacterium RIFOXYD12_FULL_60_8]|nr:MAG: gamma-glutamyl-gamma-aminobutyrate hydrolase [Alphaproteobacteria bacterium RIFOXYD12_FULL_60_8]